MTALGSNTGQTCRIVNTAGGQVVDTWAFCVDDADEYLSMEHSRSANCTLLFKPGERLFSNRLRPLLQLLNERPHTAIGGIPPRKLLEAA